MQCFRLAGVGFVGIGPSLAMGSPDRLKLKNLSRRFVYREKPRGGGKLGRWRTRTAITIKGGARRVLVVFWRNCQPNLNINSLTSEKAQLLAS